MGYLNLMCAANNWNNFFLMKTITTQKPIVFCVALSIALNYRRCSKKKMKERERERKPIDKAHLNPSEVTFLYVCSFARALNIRFSLYIGLMATMIIASCITLTFIALCAQQPNAKSHNDCIYESLVLHHCVFVKTTTEIAIMKRRFEFQ